MNKIYLLNKKPKSNKLITFIVLLTIILFILLTFKYNTYDSLNIVGIYKCDNTCYIETSIIYEDINKIDKKSILEYKNKTYIIEDIIYSEPYLNNNIAYQDIKIITNLKVKETIIKSKILYNKQRIIYKIINYITGEE